MPTSEPAPAAPGALRQTLGHVWIVALVWALSVPLAEIAFRLAGTPVAATMTGFYEPFGDSGYKLRSNASVLQDWVSGRFWVHTDARGFRVGENAPAAPEGDPDVLVLGDSQTFGQGVEFEQSVIGVFAAAARENGVSVANAAVGGHSFLDQIALAKSILGERRMRPRAVLFCLTARALAYPDSVSRFVVVDGDLWDQQPTWTSRARTALSRNSALYVTLRNALKRGNAAGAASDIFALYATGPEREARIAPLERALAELKAACDGAGASIVLAYLPLAIESKIDEMARDAHAAAATSAPLETARRLGADAGMPVIDCTPALDAVRSRGGQVSLVGDSHYGPAASREVGGLLWSALDWRARVHR